MATTELKKVSMNLSSRSLSTIEELSELIDAPNKTRVVTSALEVAKIIFQIIKKGGKVIVKDSDGSSQELKLIV